MGIGDWLSDVFGSENKDKAKGYEVDANAYEYGGRPGGAQAYADRYGAMADQAQGRGGVAVNYTDAAQSRAQQGQVADMMMARAQGRVPSIAQMQADRQMGQAQAAQASQAASARGAAGLALAQQNAANNIATAQGAISGQAQINAAQERQAAEQAAYGAYSGMRGQDAQQAQYQAGLDMQQRQLNDSMTMGMSQLQNQVNSTQLASQMNREAQRSGNALQAQGINAGVAGQNASTAQQNGMSLVGMGSSAAGGVAGFVAGKADGGPVQRGTPYLVGERGPELVIPKKDGIVIPAGQTEQILSKGYAPSTWGTGGPDVVGQRQAAEDAFARGELAQQTLGLARMESPWERTLRRTKALQAVSPELVTDEDLSEARRAQAVINGARNASEDDLRSAKTESKPAAKSGEASKRPKVAGVLGNIGGAWERQAANVDVGYRGPTGYAPPHLIQVGGARADGGPMTAGQAYLVGERGPEVVLPQVPAQPVPGRDSVAALPGGGLHSSGLGRLAMVHALPSVGDVNRATFSKPPGPASAMAPGAGTSTHGYNPEASDILRADGGPVEGGRPYVVGERGPEMVLPLFEPEGKQLHQSADGHAFYMDEADQDDGRPSLARMSPSSPVAARAPVKIAAAPPAAKAKAAPQRQMTPEELMRAADEMERTMRSEHEAYMARGSALARMK